MASLIQSSNEEISPFYLNLFGRGTCLGTMKLSVLNTSAPLPNNFLFTMGAVGCVCATVSCGIIQILATKEHFSLLFDPIIYELQVDKCSFREDNDLGQWQLGL